MHVYYAERIKEEVEEDKHKNSFPCSALFSVVIKFYLYKKIKMFAFCVVLWETVETQYKTHQIFLRFLSLRNLAT